MSAVAIAIEGVGRREPYHRRTGEKVRRNSKPVRRSWWTHFSWTRGRRLLLALRIHAEHLRRKGQRTGAAPRPGVMGDKGGISFGAIRLMEVLVAVAARYEGRLEPSAEWLGEALNVPAKSIHAWKEQLKRHGFLTWQRRYVETGRPGVRGPQVRQTTNAYVLTIPAAAEAAAEARIAPRPAPSQSKEEKAYTANPGLMSALDKYGDNLFRDLVRRGCKPQTPT